MVHILRYHLVAPSSSIFVYVQEKGLLVFTVDSKEFLYFRKKLNRTQKEMAQLLGVSVKAVRSYEQGWRSVPAHVERQLFFLVSSMPGTLKGRKPCWIIYRCPREQRQKCPAWEFRVGHLCWFINGTVCDGTVQTNWKKKMKMCRKCVVFQPLLNS